MRNSIRASIFLAAIGLATPVFASPPTLADLNLSSGTLSGFNTHNTVTVTNTQYAFREVLAGLLAIHTVDYVKSAFTTFAALSTTPPNQLKLVGNEPSVSGVAWSGKLIFGATTIDFQPGVQDASWKALGSSVPPGPISAVPGPVAGAGLWSLAVVGAGFLFTRRRRAQA